MAISAQEVKALRDKTGAGMMDCKRALQEADGDMDAAIEALRKQGIAKAEKKASREANEGLISSYIHPGGRIGVLLEINCETDFVAKTDEFQDLANDIAMQIAAMTPAAVTRDNVSEELIEKERKLYREQAIDEGKPEHIIDKIVDGRIDKFYSEVVLLEQPFVKDNDMTIEELITEAVATLGENIEVNRFVRYELGENSDSE
ncbi:MAG: translation elongation factor Ts [Candidatus Marinimicrobia bacterium]|nr:translation elongation factor Ts [Candidatus Neomarinimicrobiota bacterium]MCF7827541.1 translation elongation factor Ts [Candidatus Neomarinimicrobiota bacterium]MCF7881597.1 translation elongation factor Ts [Candidatus Neomarinimicrobiota bacterium]